MPFFVRVQLHPQVGKFGPDSLRELLQRQVALPGLDPSWRHTLVDVQVADDGTVADLAVLCEPPHARVLNSSLRIVTTTPAARVRVVDRDGNQLHEGDHPSPLMRGQTVALGADHYTVVDTTWPGRHPETGMCAGDIDWQVATVHALPSTAPVLVGAGT